MGVAFDTTAEQAGEWMATWRTALNLSQTQVTALGDQLNYLGNTTSENVLKLSEVVTRVGALGQTAGLSAGEVAALAASMPGVTAEISATGIKSMMIAMTAGASATSNQAAVLQQLGFTASDMANRMQTDAKGAIIDLLGAIKQLPAAEQTAALSQYFGKESVSSIAPLLKNLGYLQQQFAKVGDAAAYSGSMEAEYAVRADTTANKLQLMQNKLAALQVQIGNKILPYVNDALDDLSANALPKAENQRAGYVYIISNIGAFGENVYKIGMTRRLDPMDRIDELGDASVPFKFDVHAMIFSEDAPGLEAALHNAFADKKLNFVNQRREFFNVSLDEIKKVVRDNYDKSVEFIETPPAEQYRESLLLREAAGTNV